MRNRLLTMWATKVYRVCFPYLLALISVPVYLLKYRKYHAVKRVKTGFADHSEEQLGISDEMLTRLLKAYRKAKLDQRQADTPYQVGHLWQEILDTKFGELITALCDSKFTKVKRILENFNRENCGDDTCGGGQYYDRMKRVPFYKYQFINAWYKRYNSCQEKIGHVPELIGSTIGNAVGMSINRQVVPLTFVEYYCYAQEIAGLLKGVADPSICEIGGGTGGQAFLSLGCIDNLTYTVLDIPEVLVLSSYFLMTAFPEKKFVLYGEEETAHPDVRMLPNFILPHVHDESIDLVFNSCSFSEMDYMTTREYLNQIERVSRKYLMHINHNARLVWYKNNTKITNMIADEVVLPSFHQIYKEPRLFSLLEDKFVIQLFYRARYYKYLYEKGREEIR